MWRRGRCFADFITPCWLGPNKSPKRSVHGYLFSHNSTSSLIAWVICIWHLNEAKVLALDSRALCSFNRETFLKSEEKTLQQFSDWSDYWPNHQTLLTWVPNCRTCHQYLNWSDKAQEEGLRINSSSHVDVLSTDRVTNNKRNDEISQNKNTHPKKA